MKPEVNESSNRTKSSDTYKTIDYAKASSPEITIHSDVEIGEVKLK